MQEKALELENQKKQNKLDMNPAKLKKIAERKRKKLEKQRQKQAEITAANAAAGITGGDQDMEDDKMPIMTPNQLMKLENASDTISRFSVVSYHRNDVQQATIASNKTMIWNKDRARQLLFGHLIYIVK